MKAIYYIFVISITALNATAQPDSTAQQPQYEIRAGQAYLTALVECLYWGMNILIK